VSALDMPVLTTALGVSVIVLFTLTNASHADCVDVSTYVDDVTTS